MWVQGFYQENCFSFLVVRRVPRHHGSNHGAHPIPRFDWATQLLHDAFFIYHTNIVISSFREHVRLRWYDTSWVAIRSSWCICMKNLQAVNCFLYLYCAPLCRFAVCHLTFARLHHGVILAPPISGLHVIYSHSNTFYLYHCWLYVGHKCWRYMKHYVTPPRWGREIASGKSHLFKTIH